MLYYFDVNFINDSFQGNLADWCMGGPNRHGYTRAGPMVFLDRDIRLVGYTRQLLSVEDVLSKNREEVERWHVAFMRGGRIDLESDYYLEYLSPRYNKQESADKMGQALSLCSDIRMGGYASRHPVFIADIDVLELPFRFFRFDGCHRAAAAYVVGIKEIPALVFKAEAV